MRKLKTFLVAAVALAAWFTPSVSQASICGPCTIDAGIPSSERIVANGWGCRADWAGFFNRGLGIHEVDFPGGWGWTDECNNWRPLKKTHNAMYALYRSSSNPVFYTNDFSGTILDWGGNYVRRETRDLEGHCEQKADGLCRKGRAWADANESLGRIRMYIRSYGHTFGGVYPSANVVDRASTLMHEAAHLDGRDHYQDTGQDSTWSAGGAWRIEVQWLAYYAKDATQNTTTLMRLNAASAANSYLNSGFVQRPNLRVTTQGVFFANTGQPTTI